MFAGPRRTKNLYNSCLCIFFSFFTFSVVVQAELVLRSHWREQAGEFAFSHDLLTLMLSQNETLAVALIHVALFYLCKDRRLTRGVYITWLAINFGTLVFDQVFYAAFFQHIELHFYRISGLRIGRLMDSLISRLDFFFYLNFILWIGISALLRAQLGPKQSAHVRPAWLTKLLGIRALHGALLWKFIARRVGDPSPELYDLSRDSAEQNNLAALFPGRIELYNRLVAQWYLRATPAFIRRLAGYSGANEVGNR